MSCFPQEKLNEGLYTHIFCWESDDSHDRNIMPVCGLCFNSVELYVLQNLGCVISCY